MSDYYENEVLPHMIRAAVKAGNVILKYYNDRFKSWIKSDSTPVTEADIASSDIIISTLRQCYTDAVMLCEETADDCDDNGNPLRLSADHVFIIDPLDGTRSFIDKTGQFAVSISYIRHHTARAAVIYLPVSHTLYYAALGKGAWKAVFPSEDHVPFTGENISVSNRTERLRVVIGSGKNDPEVMALIKANSERIGEVLNVSSCIKGCMIAEGTADVHYKFADYTKEWDTSAMELICREAGGIVTDAFGGELISNRPDIRNLKGIRILNDINSALDVQ